MSTFRSFAIVSFLTLIAAASFPVQAQYGVSPTGSATYNYPIAVPPGIKGVQPALSLSYASGNGGTGERVGAGWSLSATSVITRCPSNVRLDAAVFNIDWDMTDRLCLDGQRLIKVDSAGVAKVGKTSNDASGVSIGAYTEYKTEEDGYSRIRAYGYADGSDPRSGPAFFKVWTKDGSIWEYGASPGSDGNTNALMFNDPLQFGGRKFAYAWAASRHSDLFGNFVDYKYEQGKANWTYFQSGSTTKTTTGLYWALKEIQYSGNKVLFNYTRDGTDGSIASHQGLGTINVTRLDSVAVYTNASNTTALGVTTAAVPVRTISLGYDNGTLSNKRRLTKITECAGGPTSTKCLPATTFTYSQGGAIAYKRINQGLSYYGISGLNTVGWRTGDFNGDGKLDVLASDGARTALLLNQSDGYFQKLTPFGDEALLKYNGCRSVSVADFDGDGKSDVYLKTWYASGNTCDMEVDSQTIFFSNGDGSFTKKVVTTLPVSLKLPAVTVSGNTVSWTAGGRAVFMDVDGDGILDALDSELPAVSGWDMRTEPQNPCSTFECTRFYKGDGLGGFTKQPTNLMKFNVLNNIPHENYQNADTVLREDFNSDGLTDITVVPFANIRTASDAQTARSQGNGNFFVNQPGDGCQGLRVDYNGDGRIDCLTKFETVYGNDLGTDRDLPPSSFDGVQAVDINSDGRTDLLDGKTVWLGYGQGQFYKASTLDIGGYPDGTIVGDFRGYGHVEFLADDGLYGKTSNQLPDLLTTVVNSSGATTKFDYVSLAYPVGRYSSDQGTSNAPAGSVIELTPTMPVVFVVNEDTGIGAGFKNSSYAYRSFRYDVQSRKSLGFREIRRQTVAPNGGALTQVTEFLQQEPYVGRVKQTNTYLASLFATAPANLLSQQTATYCEASASASVVTTALQSADSCPSSSIIHRTYALRSVETGVDLAGESLPTVTTDTTMSTAGQVTKVLKTTVQPGALGGTFTQETTNTYLPDDTSCTDVYTCKWQLSRVSKVTERRTAPNVVPTTSAGTAPNATATSGAALTGTVTATALAFDKTPYTAPLTLGSTITNTGTSDVTMTVPSATSVSGTDFSFVSTTCTATLRAGTTCVVKVKFTPTANAARSGTLTVSHSAGTTTAALTGTGLKPVLSVSPTSLAFSNKLLKTSTKSIVVTLTNTGDLRTEGLTLAPTTGYEVVDSTCQPALGPDESCTFKVSFTPVAEQDYAGSVAVSGTGPSLASVGLSGAGVTSALYLADVDFGEASVNTTKTALLRNGTASAVTITSPPVTDSVWLTVSSTTCGTSLVAGASCTITVKLGNSSTTGSLVVGTSAGTLRSTITATLSASSISLAPVAPVSNDFGAVLVGSYTGIKYRVRNNGTTTISSVALATSAPYSLVSNQCTTSLAPSAECFFYVRFTPTAVGTSNGTLTATPTSGAAATASLTGQGANAGITVAPVDFDLGKVRPGIYNGVDVYYTNYSSAAVTVSAPTLTSSPYEGWSISSQTCSTSLAAGAQCRISVRYTAPASDVDATNNKGVVTAQLKTTINGTVYTSKLSAVLGIAKVQASVTALNFGSMEVGTSLSSQSVLVTNSGAGPTYSLSGLISMSATVDEYHLEKNTCSASLPENSSCSFVVVFTPNASGSINRTLTLKDDTGGDVAIPLTGTGTTASVTVSEPSFGTVTAPATKTATATVTNTTSGALSMLVPSSSSVQGNDNFEFVSTTCTTSLAANSSCTVSVKFTPNVASFNEGTLKLTVGGEFRVAKLFATAVRANLSLDQTSVNFGDVPVGVDSISGDVTLKNSGSLAVTPTLTLGSGFVITSHTCGVALASSDTCTLKFRFTPAAAQPYAATFTASGGGSTAGLTLTGQGKGSAVELDDIAFGSSHVGGYETLVSYLTNNGSSNITLTVPTAASVTGNGFSFISTTCTSTLAPKASCSVSVRLTPVDNVTYVGALSVSTSAGTKTAALSGQGVQGYAQLSALSKTFTTNGVGMSSSLYKPTLTNTGDWPLTISSISLTAGAADYYLTHTCGTSLAVGASCTLTLKFTPSAVGSRPGTVTVASNASNGNVTLTLNGTGRTPYTSMADTLDFGSVTGGSSKNLAMTLSNVGSGDVTVTAPIAGNVSGTDFSFVSTTCGGTLAPGASCTTTVKFAPTSIVGRTGNMSVLTSEGYQQATLSGSGVGVNLAFSPSTIAGFGAVQTGGYKTGATTTLSNSGSGAAAGLTWTVPTGFSLVNNTCGTSLAAGASCTFQTRFTPTAVQSYSGTVKVTSTSLGLNTDSLTVSGTGQAPSASLTAVSFGTIVKSTELQKTSTLTNTGVGSITLTTPSAASISGGGRFFFVSTTCGTSLAAGASCTVTVKFVPGTYVGAASGTLAVVTSAGTKTASMTGTSREPAPSVTFTPAGSVIYVYPGSSATGTAVTVKNTGEATLSALSLTSQSARFTFSETCGTSLAVGASCTFTPSFNCPSTTPLGDEYNSTITVAGTGYSKTFPIRGVCDSRMN